MPITAADIKWKYSINTGPGNSTAQADPNDSIGGFMSSSEIPDATLHALFDEVSGAENAASESEYRTMFIHNDHATLAYQAPSFWIGSEVAGGASVAIALDDLGVTAENSASAQSERLANEDTAPSGETFSAPTTEGAGLTPGDVAANSCFAVIVRRTTADTGAVSNDGATFNISGDTAA